MDLAEQLTRRTVASDSVLLRVCPPHGAPDVAIDVASHTVRASRAKVTGEDLAVSHFALVGVDVKDADMGRADAAVDDVQLLLIRREADAVRLHEVIDNDPEAAILPMPIVGSVNQIEPLEATTTSFGEFSGLPL